MPDEQFRPWDYDKKIEKNENLLEGRYDVNVGDIRKHNVYVLIIK